MEYRDKERDKLEMETCEYLTDLMPSKYASCALSSVQAVQRARSIVEQPAKYKTFYDIYEALREVLK